MAGSAQIEALRKPLRLELQKGLADSAAVGGLERFVGKWAAGAKPGSPQAEAARRLQAVVRGYGKHTRETRRKIVGQALRMLEELESPAAAARSNPPADAVRPSSPREAGPIVRAEDLAALPVTSVPGFDPRRTKDFARLGIATVDDLLRHVPRQWQDRTSIAPIGKAPLGEAVTVRGRIAQVVQERRRALQWLDVRVEDPTGAVHALFYGNRRLERRFRQGDEAVLSGTILFDYGQRRISNPDFEVIRASSAATARPEPEPVVPLYPLTERVTQRLVRWYVRSALRAFGARAQDWLPASVRDRCRLLPLAEAFRRLHFPARLGDERSALDRMAFDRVFLLQLAVAVRRRQAKSAQGIQFDPKVAARGTFLAALPFTLTGAQTRVLAEIEADMASPRPMNRLLQGDVGSGKTVVAAAAAAIAAGNGRQTAVMAPTEILARQHHRTLGALLAPAGVSVALLTSGMTAKARAEARQALADGGAAVAIGTHALLEQGVALPRLGLVVVDEQHRFGVLQRAALREKSASPDVLVMTATPIPRTLAMTLFGDLDVSVIDEMPPGRTPVETLLASERDRASLVERVRAALSGGRQAYLVHPAIEENPRLQLKAATAALSRWREALPGCTVELLHGRLKAADKDATMARFAAGETAALVATTVVEVGVDVANATLIVIENAERFGLSSLHQLRGRVGRGLHAGTCVLVAQEATQRALARLRVLCSTHDGFRIAEADLELRGPGELFGTRQAGDESFPELPEGFSRGVDARVLAPARRAAFDLLERDPELGAPEHAPVRAMFLRRYGTLLPLAEVA